MQCSISGIIVDHQQIHRARQGQQTPRQRADVLPLVVGRDDDEDALLARLVGGARKGRKAAAMWLFNPVNIFTFYVFARHDAVAAASTARVRSASEPVNTTP